MGSPLSRRLRIAGRCVALTAATDVPAASDDVHLTEFGLWASATPVVVFHHTIRRYCGPHIHMRVAIVLRTV